MNSLWAVMSVIQASQGIIFSWTSQFSTAVGQKHIVSPQHFYKQLTDLKNFLIYRVHIKLKENRSETFHLRDGGRLSVMKESKKQGLLNIMYLTLFVILSYYPTVIFSVNSGSEPYCNNCWMKPCDKAMRDSTTSVCFSASFHSHGCC